MASATMTSSEREVFELYSEDLQRLTFNSKPVISNLTELANEYRQRFAHVIVRIIEERIRKVRTCRPGSTPAAAPNR